MHRHTVALPPAHHDPTEAALVERMVANLTRAVPGPQGPFDTSAAFREIKSLVRAAATVEPFAAPPPAAAP
jgi:hypothetical protein